MKVNIFRAQLADVLKLVTLSRVVEQLVFWFGAACSAAEGQFAFGLESVDNVWCEARLVTGTIYCSEFGTLFSITAEV